MGKCEQLKQEMDNLSSGDIINDQAKAAGYLSLFIQAKIAGCAFIDGLSDDVSDPLKLGTRFQLQMHQYDWDVRGSKLYIDHSGYLSSNNTNRKGDYDPAKDQRNIFRFIPTGWTVSWGVPEENRIESTNSYYLAVDDGPFAGQLLSSNLQTVGDPTQQYVTAFPSDQQEADSWTIESSSDGGWFIHCWPAHDDARVYMDHPVLDDPMGYGDQWIKVWGKNGGTNQRWMFRSVNFTD
ncbi:hypothetical protein [Streptomyces chattanoogensis]|uniref:hypothetical protein n=1 Tax=Streptomyces chattanoogensis TaxID=66876 RepID=UPI00367F45DF